MRRGFSLIEVLIAVALIDAALLALVAASMVIVRRTAELRLRTTAQQLASDRLQLLGASCGASSGHAAHPAGIQEFWLVSPIGESAVELSDSVTFDIQGHTHSTVLRTRLPC